MRKNPYKELELALGCRFRNRDLLAQALVHPSYRYETDGVDADNQRLEFLGDAVLGLLTAAQLFESCPESPEGVLTARRSRLTSGAALARVASRIGLGDYLQMGRGEERSGGRTRASNLTDALEALFGAAWLDGGLRSAERMLRALMPYVEDGGEAGMYEANPKGCLQEWTQARWKQSPEYVVLEVEGPAHEVRFKVEVRLPDGTRRTGQGNAKRAAEMEAARAVLAVLDKAQDGR